MTKRESAIIARPKTHQRNSALLLGSVDVVDRVLSDIDVPDLMVHAATPTDIISTAANFSRE